MTDGYALLRAIEAKPEEDTPRLAYADWLEEHAKTDADRARAELIRVQCELARTPPGGHKATLAMREQELLRKYGEVWKQAFPFLRAQHLAYGRGFIYLRLIAADFVKHCETLAAVTPLNLVQLRHTRESLEELAACPALRHVRYLCLESNALQNKRIPVLLASPHLTNVRVLELGNNDLGATACQAITAATTLPALQVLALHGNFAIKDRGLEILTKAPWFPNLLGLHVSNCGITAAGIIRLAGLPAVSNLRSLGISDADRNDTTARAILDSPHLTSLVRLWHPESNLSAPVREAMHARFRDKLNLQSYRLDVPDGGLVE